MPTETENPIDTPPEKRKKPKEPERGNRCLNCGKEPLDAAFCPDCGQENISYAVTLPVLLRDVLDEFLKFDGRLFRTLGALLLTPGKFTEEYNAGRRVHYLSPFKLYLVVSAAFFYLMAVQTPTREIERSIQKGMHLGTPDSVFQINISSGRGNVDLQRVPDKSDKTKKPANNKPATGPVTAAGDPMLPLIDGEPLVPANYQVDGQPVRPGNYADAYEEWQNDPKNPKKHTGMRRFGVRQMLRFLDHPGALVGQYIEILAKAMFFMVPLYGLFLAGLFRRERRFYVEHLVFAINQHTTAFLYATFLVLIRKDIPALFFAYFVVYWLYEFLSLRRVYHQRVGRTLFKQFLLNNLYFWAIIIAMGLVVFIAMAML